MLSRNQPQERGILLRRRKALEITGFYNQRQSRMDPDPLKANQFVDLLSVFFLPGKLFNPLVQPIHLVGELLQSNQVLTEGFL